MTLKDLNILLPENKQNSACLNESFSAQVLGISASSLATYRKNGLGPEFIKIDNGKKGRVIYPKTALVEWLNKTTKTA
ncbi:DNA-binding protein [Halarcobacter bivalviorum]|uniref:DNA-binding protein (HTH domain) n=1 Tax=Halarcobacter bivalviorum TaxID=663364 RepID=A0AAX2ABU7_9BACT|nr:DNA-binding protein [Halarcobacter bivalviorum]AXH12006.1 DNA-binding protein (HTH domain) [Halarcobacter bivalviorum]RXK11122.1 hypothetical protein CRV05_01775 [Halarcobacter bivalviorum]